MSRFPIAGRIALLVASLGVAACRDTGRVDAAVLRQGATGPGLRVVVLADSGDARLPATFEAIEHWNTEFRRLGRRTRFDSPTVLRNRIDDDVVRAAQNEVAIGAGPATSRLRAAIADIPGDVVIVLTHADLISFSVVWRSGSKGIVAIRRADIWPLSLPNTLRNVVAHETGHVLGLPHNSDSTTLMCGRPAPCRPAAFTSDTPRFFPLTPADDRLIQSRWP